MKELSNHEFQQIGGGFSSPVVTYAICGATFSVVFYTLFASNYVDFNVKDAVGYGVIGGMLGAMAAP